MFPTATAWAIDVDGTIIDRDSGLSPAVLEGLRQVAQHSHLILATARPPDGIRPILAAVGHPCSVVALNGAVTSRAHEDHRRVLSVIPKEVQARVLEVCGHVDVRGVFLFDATTWHAWGDSQLISHEASLISMIPNVHSSWPPTTADVCKITLVLGGLGGVDAALIPLGNELPIEWAGSNDAYIEITAKGVSKASGVADVLAHLQPVQLAAVGDGMNDIPLFRVADISYAMPHSPQAVREAATSVLVEPGQSSLGELLASCAKMKTIVRFQEGSP